MRSLEEQIKSQFKSGDIEEWSVEDDTSPKRQKSIYTEEWVLDQIGRIRRKSELENGIKVPDSITFY
jgi:hypothetical protein